MRTWTPRAIDIDVCTALRGLLCGLALESLESGALQLAFNSREFSLIGNHHHWQFLLGAWVVRWSAQPFSVLFLVFLWFGESSYLLVSSGYSGIYGWCAATFAGEVASDSSVALHGDTTRTTQNPRQTLLLSESGMKMATDDHPKLVADIAKQCLSFVL